MKKKIELLQLGEKHDRESFACGRSELDSWLKTTARQHHRRSISKTYVAVDPERPHRILGYYSLNAGQAVSKEWPQGVKGLPNQVPIVLIGRLARDLSMRGQGLGEILVVDALRRVVSMSDQIGIALIVVDAKDDTAVRFYEGLGFKALLDQPKRLVMTVATARASVS